MTQVGLPTKGYSNLLVRREGPIAILTLNRPDARNAISDATRVELIDALETLDGAEDVRALVLTGEGKAFCSGGDVRAMQQRIQQPLAKVAATGWRRQHRTHHMITVLQDFSKPTIAAVNGAAVGLGCDLALCCDFILASELAMFSASYILRGLIADGGALYQLPRRVGLTRAKELIFTGRRVDPEEALAIGLADRLSASDKLIADAVAWAAELAHGSPTALAIGKRILNRSLELPPEQIFSLGAEGQAICYTTAEHREAVEAFLNKTASR